jgi:hypothetical protein
MDGWLTSQWGKQCCMISLKTKAIRKNLQDRSDF